MHYPERLPVPYGLRNRSVVTNENQLFTVNENTSRLYRAGFKGKKPPKPGKFNVAGLFYSWELIQELYLCTPNLIGE
jgi:hypothetical protein